MNNMNNITIYSITKFIDHCNKQTNYHYDPYFDEEIETYSTDITKNYPKIHENGLQLYTDDNHSALCLTNSTDLIGFCSAFSYIDKSDAFIHELYVLISPEYRHHQLGYMLVSIMLNYIEKNYTEKKHTEKNITYLVGSNESFAQSMGFEFSHSEHFMTKQAIINTKDFTPSSYFNNINNNGIQNITINNNIRIECKKNNANSYYYRLYENNISAARCRVYITDTYANISHVYTNKKFRRKGYASTLIRTIAHNFSDKELLLHVEGNNTAAIQAYIKVGFSFAQTTDYYILQS